VKLIGSVGELLDEGIKSVLKLRAREGEAVREREYLLHTVQSLKLEINKMGEYDQELANENLELSKIM